MAKKRRKKSERQQLTADLDKACGYWVKLRDAWHMEDDEGREIAYNKCATCGRIKKAIGQYGLQWGHYQLRKYWSVRWDERNASPQCGYCNGPCDGEQVIHGREIDKKWGKGTALELEKKARDGSNEKLSIPEMKELLDHYIKQLKKIGYEYKRKRVYRIGNGT